MAPLLHWRQQPQLEAGRHRVLVLWILVYGTLVRVRLSNSPLCTLQQHVK